MIVDSTISVRVRTMLSSRRSRSTAFSRWSMLSTRNRRTASGSPETVKAEMISSRPESDRPTSDGAVRSAQ